MDKLAIHKNAISQPESSNRSSLIPKPCDLFNNKKLTLRSRIAAALARLSRAAKGTPDQQAYEVYADNLEHLPVAVLVKMFTKAERVCTFWPSPRELLALVEMDEEDTDEEIREFDRNRQRERGSKTK